MRQESKEKTYKRQTQAATNE